MSFELQVSKILRPLSFLASVRIRLKSTLTSSGLRKPSNSSTLTFTLTSFQKLFRSCDDCSFSRIPSSAFLFVTSLLSLKRGKRILHRCVGGVILLLVIGSASSHTHNIFCTKSELPSRGLIGVCFTIFLISDNYFGPVHFLASSCTCCPFNFSYIDICWLQHTTPVRCFVSSLF